MYVVPMVPSPALVVSAPPVTPVINPTLVKLTVWYVPKVLTLPMDRPVCHVYKVPSPHQKVLPNVCYVPLVTLPTLPVLLVLLVLLVTHPKKEVIVYFVYPVTLLSVEVVVKPVPLVWVTL